MNLPSFLNQVDAIAKGLSKEDLVAFVHRIARMQEEGNRERFLSSLCMHPAGQSEKRDAEDALRENAEDIHREMKEALEFLEQVGDGEHHIVGDLNEEYDDWYNSDADEFLFEDPEEILPKIQQACNLVERCADSELYAEASQIAGALLSVQVPVEGEYSDYGNDFLSLTDMDENDLISLDFKEWMHTVLLAAYLSHPMEQRPHALHKIMQLPDRFLRLSMKKWIETCGDSLEGLEEFLPLWLDYLGQQKENSTEDLLKDAVSLMPQPGIVIDAARKYAETHPIIFEEALKAMADGSSEEERYSLGREAMERIPAKYRIRGRIALLAAESALLLGRREDAERCWLEAFRSDTEPRQYLRMAAQCQDFSKYREEMRQIFERFAAAAEKGLYAGDWIDGEFQENSVERNDYYMLLFLDGQFAKVMNEAMQVQEALGWSSTFMKEGLALFLLFLCRSNELGPGCLAMCERACHMIRYGHPGGREKSRSFQEKKGFPFWDCFRAWRDQTPMEDSFQEKALAKLDGWISNRAEGIVRGQYRKQYGECAAYIAALGEVEESRGESDAKQRILRKYRERYPRHRAFHEELQQFGMIKPGKIGSTR